MKAGGTGGTITSYIWKKNGTTLSTTDSVLIIPSVSATDAGTYSVAIRNQCDEVSAEKSVKLTILVLPSFVIQPRDTAAVQGSTAFLRVIASGSDIRYQWRKNGVNRSGDTNAVLTIFNVALADSGSYDCVISNACQAVNSSPAILSITKAPSGPRIALMQNSIDFGCIDKGRIDTKTIQGLIKNEGEMDLVISAMEISGNQASQFGISGGANFTLSPGESKDISISFTAGEQISNTADITIKSNSTTGDKVLPLIAKSCFERIDTTAFSFGTLAAGMQNIDTTFQLCNTGSKDASISGMTIIGSDKFSLKNPPSFPLTVPFGECRTIGISFNADQSGTYTAGLQVQSTNESYTIPLSVEIISSINEKEYASLFVMPNPTNSIITIDGIISSRIESISIISLMGQEVFTKSGPFVSDKIELSLSDISSGVYMIIMQTRDGSHVMRKLIKQD
jgi:PKD repeat protein